MLSGRLSSYLIVSLAMAGCSDDPEQTTADAAVSDAPPTDGTPTGDVTIAFAGTLSTVNQAGVDLGLAAQQAFTGSFTYPRDVADVNADPELGEYGLTGPTSYGITISAGGVTFETDHDYATGPSAFVYRIDVTDRPTGDEVMARSLVSDGPSATGYALVVGFTATAGQAIASDALPTSIVRADWSSTTMTISGNGVVAVGIIQTAE